MASLCKFKKIAHHVLKANAQWQKYYRSYSDYNLEPIGNLNEVIGHAHAIIEETKTGQLDLALAELQAINPTPKPLTQWQQAQDLIDSVSHHDVTVLTPTIPQAYKSPAVNKKLNLNGQQPTPTHPYQSIDDLPF